ncbi:alpha/beta-hydrolase [Rhizodiscina lignyota]|uniref:Alpha/beta-hydrolase n=1 Tax=Rhizodiscina lignyota TaxID=1504668 RepID=A0A9P4M6Q5_9PEZI|nr:alpha/beta-hydrolase [Rhizodiscina lignyota]
MGQKPDKPSLGVFGRLGLLPLFIAVLGKALFSIISPLFVSRKNKPSTYYKWIVYSTFRTFSGSMTSAQEQFLSPNTDQVYLKFCNDNKIKPKSETLDDGTKLHWIGDKEASSVLLYFHGGGYNGPLIHANLDFLSQHLDYLNGHSSPSSSKPRSYSALILSYDLAPYARYPRQLAQAAMSLNYVLTTLGLAPSHILLGGDSAGGHVAIDVLAHILHPHPDRSVQEVKLPNGQRLKAALLISPWVELSSHADAYRRNAWKDIIGPPSVKRWATQFLAGAPRDPYNAPLTAPRGWWKGLSGIVEHLCICGSTDEVLIDDIEQFVEVLRAEWEGPGKLKVVRDWQEEVVPL